MTTTTDHTLAAPHETAAPSFWLKPFVADTWRRTAYALATGPVAVVALASVIIGWPAGIALPVRLAETLRIVPAHGGTDRPDRVRVAIHSLLSIPIGLASLVITAYCLALVVLNVGYPVRGADDLSDAWGGPSLAGAWAVHAAGGIVLLFLIPWVIHALTVVHGWLLRATGVVEPAQGG